MSKDERKDEKKLVNFRADSEVLGYLEGLAGRWGCGVTAVIVRAVRESYERETDTRLDEILEHLRGLPATFIETMVVRGGLEPMEPLGDESKSGWLPCRHCGAAEQLWPKAPNVWRACNECQKTGHMNFEGCNQCKKVQYQKDMEKKHGTENVDYTVDWGA